MIANAKPRGELGYKEAVSLRLILPPLSSMAHLTIFHISARKTIEGEARASINLRGLRRSRTATNLVAAAIDRGIDDSVPFIARLAASSLRHPRGV
jgi:hypothetical protein